LGAALLGLACVAGLLGLSTTARAAVVYQGEWDPGFGSEFPGMGWRASALLSLSDDCASAMTGFTGTVNAAGLAAITACGQTLDPLGGARIESLVVGFYAFPGVGPATDLYTGSEFLVNAGGGCGLSFFDFGSRDCLSSLDFDNGDVVGLQTSYSGWLTLQPGSVGYASALPGTICQASPPMSNDESRVDFSVQLGIGAGAVSNLAASIDQMDCALVFSHNQPDVVTFTRLPPTTPVPEPALALSWALGLGSLHFVAGGLKRLQRRREAGEV
jgi:hypothetical protein